MNPVLIVAALLLIAAAALLITGANVLWGLGVALLASAGCAVALALLLMSGSRPRR